MLADVMSQTFADKAVEALAAFANVSIALGR
jgi:hypothetical protein